jgi:antitoxin YefM
MRSTSYSDLRKNLAARLDEVAADRAPLLITRERGKPPAVLMSLEDFASYEETRHLLKSPRNAERLLKAIRDLDAGTNGQEHELLE